MHPGVPVQEAGPGEELQRLRKRCERERRARLEAEALAEKATRELYDLNQELRRSNQELEHFAYLASHDLQEPLRVVTSYSQRLAERYRGRLDEKADRYLHYITDSADHMRNLINGLLAYGRLDARPPAPEPVDLQAALDRALGLLRAALDESGARVTSDPLPTVRAEKDGLVLLLQNLVGNAVKFRGPDPPRIHVGAARGPRGWTLSVSDNGIGIDPAHFDQIFLPFRRLHTRREYAGTGVGLAVCRKVVERLGGEIRVESQPGEGTTFHVTLPEGGAPC